MGYYESIFIKYRIMESFDGKIFLEKYGYFYGIEGKNGGKIIGKNKKLLPQKKLLI
jgi:hypothetical protein